MYKTDIELEQDVKDKLAFAPIVGFLLGITGFTAPWNTLLISLTVYILIPFCIAQIFRFWIINRSNVDIERVFKKIHPISISALLIMLILLFGFQGEQIYQSPFIVLLIAIPIIIQIYSNALLVPRSLNTQPHKSVQVF